MHPRIRYAPLADKITDTRTAAEHIGDGANLFISGYPKLIPRELVRRDETGEQFKVNLFAGASIGVEFRQPSIYP